MSGPIMYKVLLDYGAPEGLKFLTHSGSQEHRVFFHVNEALRQAIMDCAGTSFEIVRLVNWEANET